MKICVECASKSNWDNIIETVTHMEKYPASFVGHDKIRPASLIFEVDCENADEAIKYIKSTIKATSYGKGIMFRVVPHGQLVYFQ